MLIYEKNNKLNINFDNEVSEQPDLQISKEDGKTEVLVDGQPGGGSNAPLICTDTEGTLDKTMGEIQAASNNGTLIIIKTDISTFFPTKVAYVYYNIKGDLYNGNIVCTDVTMSHIYMGCPNPQKRPLSPHIRLCKTKSKHNNDGQQMLIR